MKNNTPKTKEIINYVIDRLPDFEGTVLDDLHHNLFNTDYYIIGTYQAEEWLKEYGTFQAIRDVQEYEQDNFGEVNTDLGNAEKIANMITYIIGEQIIYSLDYDSEGLLTSKVIKHLTKQLKKLV